MGLAALWVLPLVTADDPGWMAAIGSLRPEVRRLRGRLTSNHILRVPWNEQPAGRSDQPALAALVDRGSDALGDSVKPLAPIDVPLPQSGTPPRCVRRNSARDHHRANYFGRDAGKFPGRYVCGVSRHAMCSSIGQREHEAVRM